MKRVQSNSKLAKMESTRKLLQVMSIDPLRRTILSYLWFQDLHELRKTQRGLYETVSTDPILAHELFSLALLQIRRVTCLQNTDFYQSLDPSMDFFSQAANLASRLCPWPTKALSETPPDIFSIPYHLRSLLINGEQSIVFEGSLGQNRSFVTDGYFPPVLSSPHSTQGQADDIYRGIARLPFLKPYGTYDQSILSCIYYFEVKILPPIECNDHFQSALRPQHFGEAPLPPCAVIGLTRTGFDIWQSLPGWDANSIGWHGDDGLLYVGTGEEGMPIPTFSPPVSSSNTTNSTTAATTTFGEGDTVGVGLVCCTGGRAYLLLTKNGCLIGCIKPSSLPACMLSHAYFPVVGTDCYSPLVLNLGFGLDDSQSSSRRQSSSSSSQSAVTNNNNSDVSTAKKPFLFDIQAFEHNLRYTTNNQYFAALRPFLPSYITEMHSQSHVLRSLLDLAWELSVTWQICYDRPPVKDKQLLLTETPDREFNKQFYYDLRLHRQFRSYESEAAKFSPFFDNTLKKITRMQALREDFDEYNQDNASDGEEQDVFDELMDQFEDEDDEDGDDEGDLDADDNTPHDHNSLLLQAQEHFAQYLDQYEHEDGEEEDEEGMLERNQIAAWRQRLAQMMPTVSNLQQQSNDDAYDIEDEEEDVQEEQDDEHSLQGLYTAFHEQLMNQSQSMNVPSITASYHNLLARLGIPIPPSLESDGGETTLFQATSPVQQRFAGHEDALRYHDNSKSSHQLEVDAQQQGVFGETAASGDAGQAMLQLLIERNLGQLMHLHAMHYGLEDFSPTIRHEGNLHPLDDADDNDGGGDNANDDHQGVQEGEEAE